MYVCMCTRMCVCACVYVCVRVCACVCVRVCVTPEQHNSGVSASLVWGRDKPTARLGYIVQPMVTSSVLSLTHMSGSHDDSFSSQRALRGRPTSAGYAYYAYTGQSGVFSHTHTYKLCT